MSVNVREALLSKSIFGGGGGGNIEPLTISTNGVYTATEEIDGYAPITVNVQPVSADMLYNGGNEYTDVTGGWSQVGSGGSVTKETDAIKITSEESTVCAMTGLKINFDLIKALKITLKTGPTAYTTASVKLCLAREIDSAEYNYNITTGGTSVVTKEIDVSAISGLYYVGLASKSSYGTRNSWFYKVEVVPAATTRSIEHGVQFIDYDGSIVEVWESSEVAAKTALPDNPTHEKLLGQGWNWSLADIQSHIANYPKALVTVGQVYKTKSGLTEVDVTVTKVTGKTVTCAMNGNKNWGDGTVNSSTSHTYTDYGDYTITCDGTSIPNGSTSRGGMFEQTSSNENGYWCTAIRIAENVTSIGDYAFNNCHSIKFVTISQAVSNIGRNAFSNCHSLPSITLPQNITSISNNLFAACYKILSIAIPQNVNSINNYSFSACYSLSSITFPQSLTSVGDSSMQTCYAVTNYDFSSVTAVPSLASGFAFTAINHLCKIIVPDILYNDWIVATNWAGFANYIYKASEV